MVIFKKLTIRNIAAIAEADIDFRCPELINEEIFLIDGKNGAGKSTILDCICLALYGTTARLKDNKEKVKDDKDKIDGISSKDPKSLLRKGTSKGEVSLSFIGKDGVNYIASYTIEKTRNNTFKQNKPWKLLNEDTQKTEESVKGIESIISGTAIGQNFDDFRKTVLIPQGQCAELVKESADERGKLLAKLVDCSKFEKAGIDIYNKTNTINKELDILKGKIGDIICPTDEDIQAKKDTLQTLTKDIETKKTLKEPLAAIEKAYKDKADAETTIETTTSKIETSKNEFINLVGGIKFLEKKIEDDKNELVRLDSIIKSEETNSKMYGQIQSIEGLLNSYKELSDKAEGKADDAKKLEGMRQSLLDTEKKDKAELDAIVLQVSQCDEAIDKIKEELTALDADTIKDKADKLDKRVSALKSLRDNTLTVISSLKDAKDAADTEVLNTKKEIEDTGVLLVKANEDKAAAQKAYDDADNEYKQKFICAEDIVANLRSLITEKQSEYCPVCGQKIIGALQVEVVDNMIADLDKRRSEAKNALDAAISTVKSIETGLQTQNKSLKVKLQAQTNAQSAFEERYKKYVLECKSLSLDAESDDIMADISNEIVIAGQAIAAIQDTLKKIKELEDQKKSLGEDHVKVLKKQTDINGRYTKSTLAVKTNIENTEKASKEAASLKTEAAGKYSEAKALITLKDWDQMWEEDNATAIKTIKTAADSYAKIVGNRTTLASSIAPSENTIQTIKDLKISTCEVFPDWDIDDASSPIVEVPNCQKKWIGLQRTASSLKSELDNQKDIIVKARTIIDEFEGSDPMNSIESLKDKIQEIDTFIEENNRRIGELSIEIKNDEQTKLGYESLSKEKDLKEAEHLKWQNLCDKFGDAAGKKFRDIALCFIFGGIVEKANQILKNIAPRYTLIPLAGTLELRIQDDECGGLLSLNGLSGGESFVASLSLALALATMKSKENNCDHLFIDEGFGSLDGDYLTLVMNTLHNLHTFTGGKKVGIISHVQAMSDSIPVHIQVEKHKVKIVTI